MTAPIFLWTMAAHHSLPHNSMTLKHIKTCLTPSLLSPCPLLNALILSLNPAFPIHSFYCGGLPISPLPARPLLSLPPLMFLVSSTLKSLAVLSIVIFQIFIERKLLVLDYSAQSNLALILHLCKPSHMLCRETHNTLDSSITMISDICNKAPHSSPAVETMELS